MTEDKAWDRIVDAIDTKYGVASHGRSTRALPDHHELTERVSFIEFERGRQRFKLERVAGPAIIDRKTFGSKRIGSDVRYENVYDPEEISFRTNLYRQEAGEWTAIDASELGL
ncbi:MAG TPA: hypothetical protein VLI05_04160 [Candidatus Saccharimonadia bacterium]|nr:hypothetical protein [Candidatus Saccharimonadia bacterium]